MAAGCDNRHPNGRQNDESLSLSGHLRPFDHPL